MSLHCGETQAGLQKSLAKSQKEEALEWESHHTSPLVPDAALVPREVGR